MKRAFLGCGRPWVPLAVALLAGIFFGYRLRPWGALVALVGGSLCLLLERRKSALRGGLRLVAVGWTVGFFAALGDLAWREHEIRNIMEPERRGLFVCRVGQGVSSSRYRLRGARHRFMAASLSRSGSSSALIRTPVQVIWYDTLPALGGRVPKPGELWRVRGSLSRRRDRKGFPMLRLYTRWDGAATVRLDGRPTWLSRVERWRREAIGRVSCGIEDWGAIPQLNRAMLLGARSEMPRAVKRVFADSGTIHVFAISGLHIVLVATILTLPVSMLGIPRTWWFFILTPLLIFYTVMTGAAPSAVRACIMASLYFAAPMLGRKPDSLSILCGTAVGVHLFNPSLLFDVGCQLSFAVMTGLILFCGPFSRMLEKLFRVDFWLGKGKSGRSEGQCPRISLYGCIGEALRFEAGALGVTLAAWLSSVPLTATYFGRLCPGGLLANLIIAPSTFFVVSGGCLGMVSSLFSPAVASCFNHAAGFFTWIMMKTAGFTVSLPGGSVAIEKWPVWVVTLWFSLLLVWAFYLRVWREPREMEGMGDDE